MTESLECNYVVLLRYEDDKPLRMVSHRDQRRIYNEDEALEMVESLSEKGYHALAIKRNNLNLYDFITNDLLNLDDLIAAKDWQTAVNQEWTTDLFPVPPRE